MPIAYDVIAIQNRERPVSGPRSTAYGCAAHSQSVRP